MRKSTKLIFSVLTTGILFSGCGGGGEDTSSEGGSSSKNADTYLHKGSVTTEKNAKAQLGVLANATVKIYGLGDNIKKVLFTEKTTSGSTIEEIGNFNAHENELLNDVYYLYEVNGGDDWDANDDGIVDATPLKSEGKFRAVIKGSTVKSLAGKITISAVSEMLYTKIRESIKTPEVLGNKIENASKEIIKNDLNGDGKVNDFDIVHYNPVHDENRLHTIYKEKINNVIDDIHKNTKVDTTKEKEKTADKEAPKINLAKNIILTESNTLKGKFKFKIEDESPTRVIVTGEDENMFKLSNRNNDYSLWTKEKIDFEKPFDTDKDNVFHLTIIATDNIGNTSSLPITVTIKDVIDTPPILKETYIEFPKRENLEDDLINGDILIGKMDIYTQGDNSINLFEMSSYYKDFFRIDNKGNLYLKSDTSYLDKLDEENNDKDDAIRFRKEIFGNFNKEGYIFDISITATNEAGKSKVVKFNIIITTDKDYPVKPHVISHLGKDFTNWTYGMSIAPNGKVFVKSKDSLLAINVDTKTNPFIENTYSNIPKEKIIFSQDMSKVFSLYKTGARRTENSIKIRDFSDMNDVKYLGRIVLEEHHSIDDFELSKDENTLYILDVDVSSWEQYIYIYDVSNPSSPELISKAVVESKSLHHKILLSSDENKLYVYGRSSASSGDHLLKIYDIHNMEQPKYVSTMTFDGWIDHISDSKDGSKLYVAEKGKVYSYDGVIRKAIPTKLNVFDISNINNPYLINSKILVEQPYRRVNQMIQSPNGDKLYIILNSESNPPRKSELYIIDVKDPNNLKLIGRLSGGLNDERGQISMKNISISNDGSTLYLLTRSGGMYVIDVREENQK